MPVVTDIDVLHEVCARRVPAVVARRARLVALREEALALVRERALVQAASCWRGVPLDGTPDAAGGLWLEGLRIEAPRLLPASGRLTGVVCAVATIGPALEAEVGALFAQGRRSLALALDGVGNEMLFALSRRVQDRMLAGARRRGLCIAGELRAGDPGLPLEAQPDVLALAGAERIGVGLTGTLMMNPAKSASIVQGIGHELPAQRWSRCDDCRSRPRCTLAAQAASA